MRELVVAPRASPSIRVHCLEHENAFAEFNKFVAKNSTSVESRSSTYVGNALFVYSAQCNFSGCKYPLEWIEKVGRGALDEFVNTRTGSDEKR